MDEILVFAQGELVELSRDEVYIGQDGLFVVIGEEFVSAVMIDPSDVVGEA